MWIATNDGRYLNMTQMLSVAFDHPGAITYQAVGRTDIWTAKIPEAERERAARYVQSTRRE